jgi:hypothetical protein
MLHRIRRWRSNFGIRLEEVKEAADRGPEVVDSSLGGLAQQGFELSEGGFDRIEIGEQGAR